MSNFNFAFSLSFENEDKTFLNYIYNEYYMKAFTQLSNFVSKSITRISCFKLLA